MFPDGSTSPYGLGYHYDLQESLYCYIHKIPAKKLTMIMLCNSSLLIMRYHKDLSRGVIDSNQYMTEFLKTIIVNDQPRLCRKAVDSYSISVILDYALF